MKTLILLGTLAAVNVAIAGENSKTTSVTIDNNFYKGLSDKNGDFKSVKQTVRKKNLVMEVRGSLTTPQTSAAANMRDTAHGKLTVGYESRQYGIYGSVGSTKGDIADAAYYAVDIVHKIGGMNVSRKSKHSNTPNATFHISGRRDFQKWQPTRGRVGFGSHVVIYGIAGNIESHIGIDGYVVANIRNAPQGSTQFRPDVESLPVINIQGTNIYGGMRTKYIINDKTIEIGRPNRTRAELVVGVELKRKRVSYAVEYSKQLTNEIIGVGKPSVSKITTRVTWNF
jgi:hypothetical protein